MCNLVRVSRPRFHLAIPVTDLATARSFYGEVLGFGEGRSDTHWVDFNMFGHQLVIHEVDAGGGVAATNPVDGDEIPVPHFGALLEQQDWFALRDRLVAADTNFVVEPHVRFEGEPGEQHTMFFLDPSGNALEFKSFANDSQVFAKH